MVVFSQRIIFSFVARNFDIFPNQFFWDFIDFDAEVDEFTLTLGFEFWWRFLGFFIFFQACDGFLELLNFI